MARVGRGRGFGSLEDVDVREGKLWWRFERMYRCEAPLAGRPYSASRGQATTENNITLHTVLLALHREFHGLPVLPPK